MRIPDFTHVLMQEVRQPSTRAPYLKASAADLRTKARLQLGSSQDETVTKQKMCEIWAQIAGTTSSQKGTA